MIAVANGIDNIENLKRLMEKDVDELDRLNVGEKLKVKSLISSLHKNGKNDTIFTIANDCFYKA